MVFNINKIWQMTFPITTRKGTTENTPEGILWENDSFYIEKHDNQYIVYDHNQFDVSAFEDLPKAIKWAEVRTATSEDQGGAI
jgi:predicted phosphoadenosine phosphosulfate sulfurtransferase